MKIQLGRHADSREPVSIRDELLRTHVHLVGATGAGKASTIHAVLLQLAIGINANSSEALLLQVEGVDGC